MLPLLARTSPHMRLDTPAVPQNHAVLATYLATSCHPPCRFLLLLPPITHNVTLSDRANRLECGLHPRSVADHNRKSGKNGNVDCRGQHCRTGSTPGIHAGAPRTHPPLRSRPDPAVHSRAASAASAYVRC